MANGGGGYKVPNSSTGKVSAPNNIIKNQKSHKKTTGGDLRAK
jgi:hypothetical protein